MAESHILFDIPREATFSIANSSNIRVTGSWCVMVHNLAPNARSSRARIARCPKERTESCSSWISTETAIGASLLDTRTPCATISPSMWRIGPGQATKYAHRGNALRLKGLPSDLDSIRVYARVDPEQKLQLVEAFQGAGHVVAVTGDGVNDALALRRADIGVAMGVGGSQVAREAADLVITDDDLNLLTKAVRESRGYLTTSAK